jgi:hypothetical protein
MTTKRAALGMRFADILELLAGRAFVSGGVGPRYNVKDIAPGAQTERRGGAGPVRDLLGGKALTGRLCFRGGL